MSWSDVKKPEQIGKMRDFWNRVDRQAFPPLPAFPVRFSGEMVEIDQFGGR
jgi:hypothetical protein